MHLAALYRYPVKSLNGHRLDRAVAEDRGLRDDRRWMFVDPDGTFISQRTQRALAGYRATVTAEGGLAFTRVADGADVAYLSAPRPSGAPDTPVDVWGTRFDACRVRDPGLPDLTAELGIPGARLVYMSDDVRRPVDPRYARRASEEVSFADGYPYLVVTAESLAALEAKYAADGASGGAGLDVRRFRPNLVVAGAPEAFAEDEWADLVVSGQRFYNAKPCARCGVITHDPDTGAVDRGVQRALASMRRAPGGKVLFGVNCCLVGEGGELRVGDAVEVQRRASRP